MSVWLIATALVSCILCTPQKMSDASSSMFRSANTSTDIINSPVSWSPDSWMYRRRSCLGWQKIDAARRSSLRETSPCRSEEFRKVGLAGVTRPGFLNQEDQVAFVICSLEHIPFLVHPLP